MSDTSSGSPSAISLHMRRFWRRSAKHKARSLLGGAALIYLTLPPLIQLGVESWGSLAPRSPLGAGMRTSLRVCVDHLTDEERATLAQAPERVPVHQVSPKLALVGLGEELLEVGDPSCKRAFKLGLLPQHAARLAYESTQVQVSLEAPSLSLLVQDLFYSPRGRKLQVELREAQARLSSQAKSLLPKLTQRLKERLDPTLATQLLRDPVILDALKGAVSRELFQRVDWGEVGERLADSPAKRELIRLATQDVSGWEVTRGVMIGGGEGVSAGIKQLKATSKKVDREGAWLWDMALCTLKTGVPAGAAGLTLAGTLSPSVASGASALSSLLLGGARSELCDELKRSGKGVINSALEGGAASFAKQSFESLKARPQESYTQAQILASTAWESAQGGLRLTGLWYAIAANEPLHQHVKDSYGEPAWDQLREATLSLSSDAELEGLLTQSATELKELGKRSLTALLLDREGSGPNPLLLAVIQEQLSGQARPVVRVTPGAEASKVTPEGYLFLSSSAQGGER